MPKERGREKQEGREGTFGCLWEMGRVRGGRGGRPRMKEH